MVLDSVVFLRVNLAPGRVLCQLADCSVLCGVLRKFLNFLSNIMMPVSNLALSADG